MEAVAAAASVAGIITVVGQSIDGLIKFSDFFSDISSAHKAITRLLNDINDLIQVLENIGHVLEQARARRRHQNLASLDIKLGDCAKDVQIWLATARLLRPGSDSGGRALLRKFKIAVNNTAIQTIRDEIARHKQTLSLSLAVFGRTIDIDTSAELQQIGGRFSEALSTSLNVHGAHEEALRRIEHYSMTSMRSSAHSIRSMDSISTRLSRLEATVTVARNAQPSEAETERSHRSPSVSHAERRESAVIEAEDRGLHRGVASSISRMSGSGLSPQGESSNGIPNGLDSHHQSQRTPERAFEPSAETESPIPSLKTRPLVNGSNDQEPAREVNKVSELYAEFAKKSEPRRDEGPAIEFESASVHDLLRQSLASIYPPEVVKYISLRQITTLYEDHLDLLKRRPSVQLLTAGKMTGINYLDDGTPALARPAMTQLNSNLLKLHKAIETSRDQCIEAGYSCLELDKLLYPPGIRSWAPTAHSPQTPEVNSRRDSSSVYSEDFHSSAE